MTKSSINIQPVKANSERHNKREQKLSYVREDLSHRNESYQVDSIANRVKFVKENCIKLTKRTMQAKATPIREGVLIIEENTTIQDIRRLAEVLEKEFGIKTIQAYTHKDEGHYDNEKKWKPNYHAHMVFDWTDHQTGKSIKLNKQDMVKVQSVVADTLGLERGQSSDVKHLNAIAFKIEAEAKRLKEVHGLDISELKKETAKIKQERDIHKFDLNYIKSKKEKELQGLKEIGEEKNKLTNDYNVLVNKRNELIKKIEQEQNQNQNRGFRR
jgi:hypothetical protein